LVPLFTSENQSKRKKGLKSSINKVKKIRKLGSIIGDQS
jgi:hypothetical protein